MGGVVAVVVFFEEGEMSGLVVDDDDRSVLEVVVVVGTFLPSPLVFLLVLVLLDFIDTIFDGLIVLLMLRLVILNFGDCFLVYEKWHSVLWWLRGALIASQANFLWIKSTDLLKKKFAPQHLLKKNFIGNLSNFTHFK